MSTGMLHAVCFKRTDSRSNIIAKAMFEGIQRCGDSASLVNGWQYEDGHPTGDVAVFYGYKGSGREIFHDYLKAGKHVVFIDLGYWGRRFGGRYTGYHRFSVDARHPSNHVLRSAMPPDRLAVLRSLPRDLISKDTDLFVKPPRRGDTILLCGMQKKSCDSYKIGYEEWERNAVAELRKHTQRPILYRPKPKDEANAHSIPGTVLTNRDTKLSSLFPNLHAVVTHHSNVGVDAIIEGVPVFCFDGVHRPMANDNFSLIEEPYLPSAEERQQWLQNTTYFQYSIPEMKDGTAWRCLKTMGLLG